MALIAGLRTTPTVKSSPTRNKKNLRSWEIRLSLTQVVVLSGIVTGSMACAFYLGFFSGRAVGFEVALASSLTNTVKFPIASSANEVNKDRASEVYAKLDTVEGLPIGKSRDEEGEIPKLGSIKHTGAMPLLEDEGSDSAAGREGHVGESGAVNIDSIDETAESFGNGEAGLHGRRVSGSTLGIDEKHTENQETLGSLLRTRELDGSKEESASITHKSDSSAAQGLKIHSAGKELSPTLPRRPERVSNSDAIKGEEDAPDVQLRSTGVTERVVERDGVASRPNAPSSFIRSVIPKGWFAQVGAPKRVQDADLMARKLKKSGFPVVIENARVRGEEYFRVLVGPEDTRDHADRLVTQLRRESSVKGDPFLRVVK